MLSQPPISDPSIALRYRDRQYAADLIAAALLNFDLFTFIGHNPGLTTERLCDHFGWQSRPADVLLTLCRASGFVCTDLGGVLSLTDAGREHLTMGSPWYLGPYYKPIADSPILQSFIGILKTGKPANWQAKSTGADWHESMKDETFARDFTALMNCRGITFGQCLAEALTPWLSDRNHILDVGGGSGIYCSTIVTRHSHMIATVLEQPPVDAIARKEIQKHGLSGRVAVLTADLFRDSWHPQSQQPADVILLSNVLHDWDVAEAQRIIDRAAETLPPGGLLVIHDAFIDSDKAGPLPVAEYSALLMNITQGKCYSVAEYEDMLEQAGFEPGSYQATTGDRGFLTAIKTGFD
jgi:2-polyprenyl-3-methyl-5-hydroxy-6-metoxy-1,4-benzoquinol methylase